MRKTIISILVLAALWAGYIAWPFASLFNVVRAAQAGNTAAIEERVNFPALRRSLASQIISTYARLAGVRLERAALAVGLAVSIADPLVEKLATPGVLAELLRSGWPKTAFADLPDAPQDIGGLDPNALGNLWQLYLNSDYGLGEVRITVPVSRPPEKQFRVHFALSGWTWKLSGLELPQPVQERFARELMRQSGVKEIARPEGAKPDPAKPNG